MAIIGQVRGVFIIVLVMTGNYYVTGRVPPGLQIAFSAYRDTETVGLGVDQTIKFDKILTNDGDAYDGNSGIFYVPVTGTYFFTWTVASRGVRDMTSGIKVNTEYIVHAVPSLRASHNFDMATNSVILKLKFGDKVEIAAPRPADGIFSDPINDWYYPTFSGYLLYVG